MKSSRQYILIPLQWLDQMTLDEAAERYLSTVKPMHRQFVEPSKRYADLILPEGGESGAGLLLLIQRMAYHIENGDIVDRQ